MVLINGMMGRSLTGDEIKKMVVPSWKEQGEQELTIPERAAAALGVKLERIIGPGHSDDKLMVIWLETFLADPVAEITPSWLAQKYCIPEKQMMDSLCEISSRLNQEPHLKIIVAKLQREFETEINENQKEI